MPIDLGKIEVLRKRAGLTQAEVAARVGMTRQRWNDLVRGRHPGLTLKTVERIAAALGVKVADILLEA